MNAGTQSLHARRIGNWTYTAYGHVFALPPDLAQSRVSVVPNRADRRAGQARPVASVGPGKRDVPLPKSEPKPLVEPERVRPTERTSGGAP